MQHYTELLIEHLQLRKAANSSYSLRAFSRDLGIAASNLSEILKRRQGISLKTAQKVSQVLSLEKKESEIFLTMVQASDARSKKDREQAKAKLLSLKQFIFEKDSITQETFKLISEWYHFAILELIGIEDFKNNSRWISKKMGIDEELVKASIQSLKKIGLIVKQGRSYQTTNKQLEIGNKAPSFSIKKYHQQLIKKAMESIFTQDIYERELQSLTCGIHEEDISYLKAEIRNFKQKIDKELIKRNKKRKPNRVYALNIQLFNLCEE